MDWIMFGLLVALLVFNLIILKSASSSANLSSDPNYLVKRQLIWIIIGLVVMFATIFFDYRNFRKIYHYMYAFLIILLILVLFTEERNGASRWFSLGFMDLQPSELGKLIMIIAFACLLLSFRDKVNRPLNLLMALAYMGLPLILILQQPDLGTAIVYVLMAFAIAWAAGVSPKLIIIVGLVCLVLALGIFGLLYTLTDGYEVALVNEEVPDWLPLKDYQLNRLTVFINPYVDPLGKGWNAIQAEVAVGSGGLWGKGYGEGTQVHNRFLSFPYTDFIFSVVGEELGFVGCAGVLLVYLCIILRGLRIAHKAQDKLGMVISSGVMFMFAGQIFINAGMCIGLMPITGITMPFMSYGGSSMLVNMICMGLVFSVAVRSKTTFFDT